MTPSHELAILRWLSRCSPATAAAIGAACAMAPGEVRSRLAALESRRLVSSRQDRATVPPKRVYFVTGEGRRAAGLSDARMQDA